MSNVIFLGAPGSGKGTQSALLVDKAQFNHVSTGNLLREEIAKQSELGLKVKAVMDEGKLVSDELVVELLKANLDLGSSKYIFDGYPRNIAQAKTLVSILDGVPFQAIYFKLDTEKLVDRLKNRRMTKDGKNIYNVVTNPPKVAGVCDVTGEALIQRDDDKEDVVRHRMSVFDETIGPVLDYFKELGKLLEIDADQSVEIVYDSLISKIS